MRKISLFLIFVTFAFHARAGDMDFGIIEFSAANPNIITMSHVDGDIICSNTTDYVCPSSGTRGSFLLPGSVGDRWSIRCTKTGYVSNGTQSLLLRKPTIRINGSNYLCNGGGVQLLIHTITGVAANDTVYMGGEIVVPIGGPTASHYDSYTGSGAHIVLVNILL